MWNRRIPISSQHYAMEHIRTLIILGQTLDLYVKLCYTNKTVGD
jgi:hypothetical protein